MQYLISVLGNIVFATLDIPLLKSQYKFFGSIIILNQKINYYMY